MRQVVLDTETTGLEVEQGHRVLEIGCVELIDRKLTGRHFHHYINPHREIDDGALEVHGITQEFLKDKPVFADIFESFLDFVEGAELIIHNAAFDVAFLNHELALVEEVAGERAGENPGVIADYCSLVDSLKLARTKHPGQKNNLNALCKRYGVDNSQRDLHGALLDAEILADVYLLLTGGQTSLGLGQATNPNLVTQARTGTSGFDRKGISLKVIRATPQELAAHEEKLALIDNISEGQCVWIHSRTDSSIEKLD